MLSVIPHFSIIRYLIFSQILSKNPLSNNTKCLKSRPKTLINQSILSRLIHNGFGPMDVLREMLKIEIFPYVSYDFLFIKMPTA